MAIHNEVVREGSEGIAKQFEMSAQTMMFDNLQKNQYRHPEKSTIRELFSNAQDAINEKLTALKIISSKAKVEDFYLTREEALYLDSNYMPEYYEKKWLSSTLNEVLIIYEEALPGVGRDILRIIDNGVGIGHVVNPNTRQSRLQGFLKLGYSTKRNSSIPLGKFGIGAKSPLSTGVDSYTVITRHNGREFHFEVYDYKAQPTVPAFNLTTSEANPFVIFEDWEKTVEEDKTETWKLVKKHIVYYLPTHLMNGTEIIVSVKRHHRSTYEQAVLSQLLYFKNIKFKVKHEDGTWEEKPVQAEIQYEDDFIILSDNNQFSKPHFVLNGVNYGYVDFQELELEERLGNIAYKIKPESVTVNPSRESLIWDDTTRATVLACQQKVADIASELVSKEMDDTDLINWLRKCTSALGDSRNNESIVGKLANLVDRDALKPIFKPYPDIRYKKDPKDFFIGMEMVEVTRQQVKKKDGSGYVEKPKREAVKSWTSINKPMYLQNEATSPKREAYMLNMHPEGFIKLKVRNIMMNYQESDDLSAEEVKEFEKLREDTVYYGKWEAKQRIFYKYLKESEAVKIYEDVPIPDSGKEESEDEDAEAEVKSMSNAELRAIQGKTVCMYPKWYPYYEGKSRNFTWVKEEPIIKNVMLDKGTIVYGFAEDDELIHMVANLLAANTGNTYSMRLASDALEFYNKDFKLVRVAISAAKHYKNHIYIKDFIASVNLETRSIAMHSKLVNWHTGRKIEEVLDRMKFLENFRIFNPEIQAIYEKLKEYKEAHFHSVKGSSTFGCNEEMLTDLNNYADKIIELQLYIEQHPGNTAAIAAQAKSLFETEEGEETFEGAVGVDIEIYKNLQQVIEYIEPLEKLFNHIDVLLDEGTAISPELEYEIKEIMRNKGVLK